MLKYLLICTGGFAWDVVNFYTQPIPLIYAVLIYMMGKAALLYTSKNNGNRILKPIYLFQNVVLDRFKSI